MVRRQNLDEPMLYRTYRTRRWASLIRNREFDGIGSDAKTGVMMGFYRDPNYAILGTGEFL